MFYRIFYIITENATSITEICALSWNLPEISMTTDYQTNAKSTPETGILKILDKHLANLI